MVRVAVVVCTLGRNAWLGRVLASLAGQGADQIIVIDQGGDAGPACALAGAEHHIAPARGLPAARNVALGLVQADAVLFLDDDVVCLPGCVAAHRRAYADPQVGGVAGRIRELVARPNARPITNRLDLSGRIRTNLDAWGRGPIETLKGAQMSFRVAALRAAGGFDEALGGTAFLEDAEASLRVVAAGWRLVFEGSAQVVHHSAPSGGCRVPDPEGWRFHNTGYVLARHLPGRIIASSLVFSAIALRRAWEARDLGEASRLLGRWRDGVRRGMVGGGG